MYSQLARLVGTSCFVFLMRRLFRILWFFVGEGDLLMDFCERVMYTDYLHIQSLI